MAETAMASKSEPDVDAVAYGIDDLPEAILEHILSFVPMEDAIRTSVLSKKWRYLWTSYPYLELNRWRFSRWEKFTNIVDRMVLQSSSRLKRWYLRNELFADLSRINLWISTAVKRNVEDFRVDVPCNIKGDFVLPCCLFSCATLTHFVLCLPIPSALKLPSRIWVPNLKVLLLKQIMFVDERLTEQLLSSPALEELSIEFCIWNNLKALNIRAPMLKNLTIEENSPVPRHSCRVLICGNNLERLHLISAFPNDYRVEKVCSLLEAHIIVLPCPPTRKGEVAHRLLKVLESMCSLKKLKLSSNAVEVLRSADELCSHLPVFPNLKLLDFKCSDLKLEAIIKLLHNAPHLEALRWSMDIKPYSYDDKDVMFDSAPRCFSSHLRQIEVFDLFPHPKVLHVLGLLLKHAIVLEKLIICQRWHPLGEGIEKVVQKKLLDISCRSKSLKIIFVTPKELNYTRSH